MREEVCEGFNNQQGVCQEVNIRKSYQEIRKRKEEKGQGMTILNLLFLNIREQQRKQGGNGG